MHIDTIYLWCSGPSGILGSGGKQNTAGGVRVIALFISSHESIKPSMLFSYIACSLFLKDPFFQII